MTAEEFAKLDVELYSDHYRFELACGELAVREPVAPTHGSVLMNLARVLSPHVHKHRLGKLYGGDTSIFIDRNTVLGADVAFIQRDRLPLSDERWLLEPDLVIEVISPSNNPRYLAQKLRQYLSIGTRLVWYIDPRRRQIDVYRADGSRTVLLPGDTLSGEDVVEGFTCDVSEILDT